MDPLLRAQLVIVIEDTYRSTLRQQLQAHTSDPEEQEQIAGAVLAMMLRKMYLVRGQAWLESILTMVLQPAPTVGATTTTSSSSPATL